MMKTPQHVQAMRRRQQTWPKTTPSDNGMSPRTIADEDLSGDDCNREQPNASAKQ